MSLRVKVELVLFIVVGLVVGLGYGIQRYVILPRLLPLGEDAARADIVGCVDALEARVALLEATGREWRGQPGLTGGATLTEEALASKLLADDLSFAYMVEAGGGPVWGMHVDEETGLAALNPALDPTQWPASHPLLSPLDSGAPVSGVFLTAEGPALVTARAVQQAEPRTPSGRVFVLGRLLNGSLLAQLFRQTTVAFELWTVRDPALPAGALALLNAAAGKPQVYVTHMGEDLFRGRATYPDIEGRPALLLQADLHGDTMARASDVMQRGLLAQVGIGLTALVVLIVLFRKTMMDAITRLTNHTVAIGTTGDLSSRLQFARTDELGTLAHEFDEMVGRLEHNVQAMEETQGALRESEERYALAVRGANDGLWDWDFDNETVHYTARWKAMLGYAEDEVGGEPDEWFGRVHDDDRERVRATLQAHLEGSTAHFESEYRMRHSDGSYLWMLCRAIAVRDEAGKPTRMAGSQTDITARKHIEEQLSHQALHDPLTALPNRALLMDRLDQALRQAKRREGYLFAVLFLDLDRFKVVNDSLGHMVGDSLLTAVADRLRASIRESDTLARGSQTVARFGGDEFVVLLDNIAKVSDAALIAERIAELLKEPFRVGDQEIYSTASIGIALSSAGYESPDAFIRSADTAMYRAKARGTGCYELFDADMHSHALKRLQVESDLRRAIASQEFEVFYQPIVSLRSGRIESFEALVRWRHPEQGLVPPVEFIPVAEETGLITSIGRWVMEEACRQVGAWQRELPPAASVSVGVNLSAIEFADEGLVDDVKRVLAESRFDPQYLKLEITESAIMENIEVVANTMRELCDLGIQFSIDDFGTGYSSLSYLHRLPMSILKVDRMFVRDMHASAESRQIVRTVVMLAHALQKDVVAEGIEEPDQLAALRGLRCRYGQGYLFSPPVPADEAAALLLATPTW